MQAARYEGLDNSPMYDGEFFDPYVHRMMLWDVGMSSMVVAEADALAIMAAALGRPAEEAARLTRRADGMRKEIADKLWSHDAGLFVNKFVGNQEFYPRLSPTSFYGLLAGAATDDQAASVVTQYLFSPEHFCIAKDGAFTNNTDACYWGLPSIQASDDAFPKQGYWRGYVWGPMAQLTFWSLRRYAHVPVVAQGIAALAAQMEALMLTQWNAHRHICENYSPHKVAADCTGTLFYHWGALTGLLAIQHAGYIP